MNQDPRNKHIDYIEFPAPSAVSLLNNKAFYKDVFGWSFQDWGPEYSDTKDSGLASGMSASEKDRPRAPLAVIYSSELEKIRDRIPLCGGSIVKDITPFPGGRRFEYVDPAGNRLGVWSDK